jgi:protein required for attachment to host cells
MSETWVVIADSSQARLFSLEEPGGALQPLKGLCNPDSRLRESQLVTDQQPGQSFNSGGRGRHAMGEAVSPQEHEAMTFAKELADKLELARAQGRVDKLVIAAAPAFLGELRKKLSDQTARIVSEEIDKNLAQMSVAEIREHLLKDDS